MAVTRSEEYYFPRDNLVIQVEDTLFRLYSGTLELHSGFFRDMFATPSSDSQEGTSDEYPLRLPPDLCSAESFTTLCKLIYPKEMGVFPPILVKDFAKWEPVLNATEALQMTSVQNYILSRFQDNQADVKTEPIRLLSWAMRSGLPLESLRLECFYALAYRRRPLSGAEINVLGGESTALVVRIREKIRGLFFLIPDSAGSLMTYIPTYTGCKQRSAHQSAIFEQIIRNMTEDDPPSDSGSKQDNLNILQILHEEIPGGSWYACVCSSLSNLESIAPQLRKAKLDEVVQRYVLGVTPSVES